MDTSTCVRTSLQICRRRIEKDPAALIEEDRPWRSVSKKWMSWLSVSGWWAVSLPKNSRPPGYKVVGLERGQTRFTVPEFQSPAIHDELRFDVRKALMQDNTREPVTFRNHSSQVALPVRRWESFLPGTGLGGSMVHWNGQTYRFQANDFQLATRTRERYGKNFLDPDLTIQDWGVTYDELEPHYDRFEYLLGTSGKAGNIKGQIQPGGDPHESPRSREYPTPPMKEHFSGAMFRKAASSLGYHPFPQPSSNLSQPYTNPEGMKLNACVFCGFCERYACEHYAKSVPQTIILPVLLANPNFELRTGCQVQRINLDSTKKHATGVTYIDAAGPRIRTTSIASNHFDVRDQQCSHAAVVGHRHTLRSGHGPGRCRPQLCLSDHEHGGIIFR